MIRLASVPSGVVTSDVELAIARLDPLHLDDLRSSGLSDETIAAAGIHTIRDPVEISRVLNWATPAKNLGPCMCIPFFGTDGKPTGCARLKPSEARLDKEKKEIKYEQPRGATSRAYFSPLTVSGLQDKAKTLVVVEGEKKCLAASQAGHVAIGLTGVENWSKKREKDPSSTKLVERQLIDDLLAVEWNGRDVLIVFDTDSRRNPAVNHAAAEFARVLSLHGAKPQIVELPEGPLNVDGLPGKMGIDDFLLAYGPQQLHELIDIYLNPPQARDLNDYRHDLRAARIESVSIPGVYLDRSPTGAGKTVADIPAMDRAGKSLLVLPTHKNCHEAERMILDHNLHAAAYPKMCKETCKNYEKASKAIDSGLSVSGAICPKCEFRVGCEYQDTMKQAELASHSIATHSRATLSFAEIANGRPFISVHEDVTNLLRPVTTISKGLENVVAIAQQTKASALRWKRNDTDTWWFANKIQQVGEYLLHELANSDGTKPLVMPSKEPKPANIDARLFRAMEETGIWPHDDAMKICKGVAAGEVDELVVRIDSVYSKGGAASVHRSILAVWKTEIPSGATTWLSDATADRREIESLIGQPVRDMTPGGKPSQLHPPRQVPADITKRTSARVVIETVRGVLALLSFAQRVGVICHREHVSIIDGTARQHEVLDEASRRRIPKIEYFRSGEGRGSNAWIDECDAVIVLGTPRVPPSAIRQRLIQAGKATAAARNEKTVEWTRDYWLGQDEAGNFQTVRCLAYRDRDWHAAYRSVVRSELIQAVGRGRGLCMDGKPVVVVTTEPLGLTLTDFPKLSNQHLGVLDAISELTQQNATGLGCVGQINATQQIPTINYLGNCCDSSPAVTTPVLASRLKLSGAYVRRILGELEADRRVERVGKRGGWRLAQPSRQAEGQFDPAASPAPSAMSALAPPAATVNGMSASSMEVSA